MESLLGLVFIYAWAHGLFVLFAKNKEERNDYENAIIVFGLVGLLIGIIQALAY